MHLINSLKLLPKTNQAKSYILCIHTGSFWSPVSVDALTLYCLNSWRSNYKLFKVVRYELKCVNVLVLKLKIIIYKFFSYFNFWLK